MRQLLIDCAAVTRHTSDGRKKNVCWAWGGDWGLVRRLRMLTGNHGITAEEGVQRECVAGAQGFVFLGVGKHWVGTVLALIQIGHRMIAER